MDKWTEHLNSISNEEYIEEVKEAMRQKGQPIREMVKAYKVKVNGKEDVARIIINFLSCTLYKKPEIEVLNTKEEPKYLPGYYEPYNAYAGKYDRNHIPDIKTLSTKLEQNDYMFKGIAAFDREDNKRIGLTKFPTEDNLLVLSVHFKEYDKNKIMRIIKYLEETPI